VLTYFAKLWLPLNISEVIYEDALPLSSWKQMLFRYSWSRIRNCGRSNLFVICCWTPQNSMDVVKLEHSKLCSLKRGYMLWAGALRLLQVISETLDAFGEVFEFFAQTFVINNYNWTLHSPLLPQIRFQSAKKHQAMCYLRYNSNTWHNGNTFI